MTYVWTGLANAARTIRSRYPAGFEPSTNQLVLDLADHAGGVAGVWLRYSKRAPGDSKHDENAREDKEIIARQLAESVITAFRLAVELDIQLDDTLTHRLRELREPR